MSKRKIIHFGPGGFWPGKLENIEGKDVVTGRIIHPNERHICFEPNIALFEFGKTEIEKLETKNQIKYRNQDATNTGLKENSAHEVHIHNVLNDFMTDSEGRKSRAENLLREARRIVAPNGAIYVGADHTPETFTKNELIALAAHLQLKVEFLADYEKPSERRAHLAALVEIIGLRGKNLHARLNGPYYLAKLTK